MFSLFPVEKSGAEGDLSILALDCPALEDGDTGKVTLFLFNTSVLKIFGLLYCHKCDLVHGWLSKIDVLGDDS